jgi:type IV secretion system protein VirD4
MLNDHDVNDLLSDMPRGVPGKDPEKTKPSGASFAGADDLRPHVCAPLAKDRLVFGRVKDSYIGILDDRHVVTFAGTRAGKGVSALIPNLLGYDGSMVIVAPKSELPEQTARHRAERLGHTVFLHDAYRETKPSLACFLADYNPYATLTPDSRTFVDDGNLVADGMVIPEGSSHATHWDESSRLLIAKTGLHVCSYPDYAGRRNLNTLRDLLINGRTFTTRDGTTLTGMAGLWAEMQDNQAARGTIAGTGASFASKSVNESSAILSTARRHTEFLDSPSIQDAVDGNDIDFRRLKREKMTVYVTLPASRLADNARLFRLVLNGLFLAMESEKTKPALPVICLIDEFHALGYMRLIEVAAGLVAGYSLRLWTVFQDLTQLQSMYRHSWETFLSNAGVVQCFANSDLTSLEWISKKLGMTSVLAQGSREVSLEDRKQGVTGAGKSHNMAALLEPHEIGLKFRRNDPRRRQLLLLAGEKPIVVLSRAVSYLDSPYKELLDTD